MPGQHAVRHDLAPARRRQLDAELHRHAEADPGPAGRDRDAAATEDGLHLHEVGRREEEPAVAPHDLLVALLRGHVRERETLAEELGGRERGVEHGRAGRLEHEARAVHEGVGRLVARFGTLDDGVGQGGREEPEGLRHDVARGQRPLVRDAGPRGGECRLRALPVVLARRRGRAGREVLVEHGTRVEAGPPHVEAARRREALVPGIERDPGLLVRVEQGAAVVAVREIRLGPHPLDADGAQAARPRHRLARDPRALQGAQRALGARGAGDGDGRRGWQLDRAAHVAGRDPLRAQQRHEQAGRVGVVPAALEQRLDWSLHHAVVELGVDRVADPLVHGDGTGERVGLRANLGRHDADRQLVDRRLRRGGEQRRRGQRRSDGAQAPGAQRLGSRRAPHPPDDGQRFLAIGQLARRRALLLVPAVGGLPAAFPAAGAEPTQQSEQTSLPVGPGPTRGLEPLARLRRERPRRRRVELAALRDVLRFELAHERGELGSVVPRRALCRRLGPGAQGTVEPVVQTFACARREGDETERERGRADRAGDPHGRFTSGAPGAMGADDQTRFGRARPSASKVTMTRIAPAG